MRCARKISRRMTILQLKAGRHGIYMCILHAIFICKKEQGRGGKEEERKGERRAEDTTRAKSRQRRGRWPGGGGAAAAPAAGGVDFDFEKLRVARMEANTEFLRGLGLA